MTVIPSNHPDMNSAARHKTLIALDCPTFTRYDEKKGVVGKRAIQGQPARGGNKQQQIDLKTLKIDDI